jgi:hypothetical protein
MVYRRNHIIWSSVGMMFILLYILAFALSSPFNPSPLVRTMAGGTWLICFVWSAAFASFLVVVDLHRLRVAFGSGLIGISVPLAEIQCVRLVSSSFFLSPGVRWVNGAWIWKAGGASGVEITLKDGRRHVVVTRHANELHAALEQQMQKPS